VKELKKPKNIFRQAFKIITSHTRGRTTDQSIVTLSKIIYIRTPVELKLVCVICSIYGTRRV